MMSQPAIWLAVSPKALWLPLHCQIQMLSMPSRNSPRFGLRFLVSSGVFLGGAILGLCLAIVTVPGSGIAYFLGFSMLPLGYLSGHGMWNTLDDFNSICRWVARFFNTRAQQKTRSRPRPTDFVPPGSFSLVVTCVGTSALAGILTAIFLPVEPAFGTVVTTYVGLGLIYGGLCWRLARSGYLQDDNTSP